MKTIFIISIIAITLLAIAGSAYLFFFRDVGEIACPQDAILCPDGSYVSRTGPNCAFAPCPSEKTHVSYRNETYGVVFQYPYGQNFQEHGSAYGIGGINHGISFSVLDGGGFNIQLNADLASAPESIAKDTCAQGASAIFNFAPLKRIEVPVTAARGIMVLMCSGSERGNDRGEMIFYRAIIPHESNSQKMAYHEVEASGEWDQRDQLLSIFEGVVSSFRFIENSVDVTSDLKTYRNEEYGFEVKYPSGWLAKSENFKLGGEAVTLNSPENQELLRKVERGEIYGEGYGDDMRISFASSIREYFDNKVNDYHAETLEEYISKAQPTISRVRRITFAGYSAFDMTKGGLGSYYSIMVDKNGEIYEVFFSYKWLEMQLSDTERAILSSFKFTK